MTKPNIAGDRWVAIYQSFCSSSIWTDTTPIGKNLALWLIIHANHTTKNWCDIKINRGQQFRSICNLAEDLYCSRKSLGQNLRELEKLGFISLSEPLGKKRGFLITIKNYCKYQYASETDSEVDRETDNEVASENDDDDEFIEGPAPGIFTNGAINISPRILHHSKRTLLENYLRALSHENSGRTSNRARTGLTALWLHCGMQQKVEFEDMTPEKFKAIVESDLDPNDVWNAYIKAEFIKETDNGIIVLTEEFLESLD